MVVDKEGKVAPRPVKVGSQQGSDWVILGGLQPGEQVIVEGFQKIRPGAPVKASPWQRPGAAPAAGASAPAASAAASAPASAAKK
jgi:membrane fusion protein (multidrug efflux system)